MTPRPSAEITVGIAPSVDADPSWRRIVRQEGLPHADATGGPEHAITVTSGAVPTWAERYVADGGVLVVSGAEGLGDLAPEPVHASIQHVATSDGTTLATPCIARLFPGDGAGQVRLHEDRVTKDGIEQDVFPLVSVRRIGRGHLVWSGVPLTDLLGAGGDRLRRFSRFTDVTERVATVDKAGVADVLVGMLRDGFELAGLPPVGLGRFSDGAASVLIWRVDVDGAFGDRTRALAAAAARQDVRASFFINGRHCEDHPGELRDLPGDHEIGHHGYVHNLFPTVEGNVDNLERGAAWVESAVGAPPTTFVAPRGLWNHALDTALARTGHPYSSDFAIDFDSLPWRTPAGVLQVPVHPYSPERAAVFAAETGRPDPTPAEVGSHYIEVLRDQVRNRRPAHLYGHPEVLGAMADDVLPAVVAAARAVGVGTCTLAEYAAWWAEREHAGVRLWWDSGTSELQVTFAEGGPWSLSTPRSALGRVVAADARRRTAPIPTVEERS